MGSLARSPRLLLPLQNAVDRAARYRVIRRPRFLVDLPRALHPLFVLGKLLVKRLEELPAALLREEALQRLVRRVIAMRNRLQQPLVQDLRVAASRELERAVEVLHLLAREAGRQMPEEMNPFVRRPLRRGELRRGRSTLKRSGLLLDLFERVGFHARRVRRHAGTVDPLLDVDALLGAR